MSAALRPASVTAAKLSATPSSTVNALRPASVVRSCDSTRSRKASRVLGTDSPTSPSTLPMPRSASSVRSASV
jgi:hypothetical protein